MTYRKALSSFDRRVWLFLAAWGLVAFAYFGVIGVLLNLYLLRLGFDVAFIGLLIGSGQLVWAISAFPSAAIGTRIGLRRAMIIALSIAAGGMALLLLVELLPAPLQPPWLLFTWSLLWLGASLLTVSSLPYLAGITQDAERNYAFGARQTTIAMLTILGSLVAGVLPGLIASREGMTLDDPAPYRMALLVVPLCFAAATLLMAVSPPAITVATPEQQRRTHPVPLKLLLAFGLVAILQTASEGPLRAFFNVYMSQSFQLPASQIGLIIALANGFGVAATLLMTRLMSRRALATLLAVLIAGLGCALALMGALPTLYASVLSFMAAMFLISGIATTRAPFSQEIVEAPLRPATSAILTLAVALGWGVTAIAGGVAILSMGYSGVFLTSAIFAFLSATVLVIYFVRRSSTTRFARSSS